MLWQTALLVVVVLFVFAAVGTSLFSEDFALGLAVEAVREGDDAEDFRGCETLAEVSEFVSRSAPSPIVLLKTLSIANVKCLPRIARMLLWHGNVFRVDFYCLFSVAYLGGVFGTRRRAR